MANSPSGDSMLDRLVRILDAFDAHNPQLTVSALSRRADIPKATMYRLLDELVSHDLLARDNTGQVRLGLRLWELTNRSAATYDLRTAALPFMEDINQLLGQNTQLSVLNQDEVLIIERLSRPGSVVNQANVAGRMPVHRTSMGMALLAFSRPEIIRGFLERHRELMIAAHPDFHAEIVEIRRIGFASLDGFIDSETTGVAAPILDEAGYQVAVISVVVPRDSGALQPAALALRTAARGIARALHIRDS
ncbi:IclR family transcriptional regulator [Glutamicibacter nicotianae]|uniref:IclR family transcriptional regulator n=1 Tax=Glutamicibacter nicotianae TaxID=37929 RepID=UPI001958D0E0|nr:IclR family transcriptional regulator [Glutamicibacter nicotianae]MBM7767245.1 DNA-binding IclR family transcriptional regulator [Glutamicibacter nicotianae]